jgi:hypothetical protein
MNRFRVTIENEKLSQTILRVPKTFRSFMFEVALQSWIESREGQLVMTTMLSRAKKNQTGPGNTGVEEESGVTREEIMGIVEGKKEQDQVDDMVKQTLEFTR